MEATDESRRDDSAPQTQAPEAHGETVQGAETPATPPLRSPPPTPMRDMIDAVKSLQIFNQYCRTSKRLTPNTQLFYRLLIDAANMAHWAATFEVTNQYIMDISGLSKDSITRAKRQLKNHGFIDFSKGIATSYSIYSLTDRGTGNRATRDNREIKRKNKTTKEEKKIGKEERSERDDNRNHDSNNNRNLSTELAELLN